MHKSLAASLSFAVIALTACEAPSPTMSAPAGDVSASSSAAAPAAAPTEGLQFYLAEADRVARACDAYLSGGSAQSLVNEGYSLESRPVRSAAFGPLDASEDTYSKSVNGGFGGSFLGKERILRVRTVQGNLDPVCDVIMRGVTMAEDKPAFDAIAAALPAGKYRASLRRESQMSTIIQSTVRISR